MQGNAERFVKMQIKIVCPGLVFCFGRFLNVSLAFISNSQFVVVSNTAKDYDYCNFIVAEHL